MNEKTPGQIAYEANTRWYGHTSAKMTDWNLASPGERAKWDYIGQAVANAVAPVPEP